ncbi:hypothetical protein RB620_04445 [Paenibacillus sp. LHD-117]|uniref:hypothetical protein n=1 Tax=Paenibacillus sp. LHD-117 TaxID=3071412 RepID=UPI0027E0AED8|nr:hypothetical protein [Paenibacillus sp. LHD-117]MDQ6418682.1 hypothetical protein [Paenibacillus sp. LHD-117]
MVDEIEQLARILETKGLEEETSALINLAIREQVEKYRTDIRAPAPANVSNVLGQPDIMQEWVHGPTGGD